MADATVEAAEAALRSAVAGDTIVLAVINAAGELVIHTRTNHPQHLARIAAHLVGEAAERIDMGGALDNTISAGLLIACQDAETTLRDALGDD